MSNHGAKARIGMIGRRSAYPALQIVIEAFEPTRGAQEVTVPLGMALEHRKIGDGSPEVGAETTDGSWLRDAIAADHGAIALQHGREPFGVPDVPKVVQDRIAAAAFFFGGEMVVVDANRLADIAQLMKEAPLFSSAKVDGIEGCAETSTAIVDDELEAVFGPDSQRFQFAENSQPVRFILFGRQPPGEDFGVRLLWPHAQGNENRTLDAALD